jgi:hypothetical protein
MALISRPLNFNKILFSKTTRLFTYFLLISTPWILLLIVTKFVSHNSLSMLIPCWNDEISYWHEILSFSSKGLNFGYYTINEVPPKLLSFGTHGFGTISVYAGFAKIFGWSFNSIVIANNFFLSLAFLLLVIVIKPSSAKSILILFLYLSYTPLILYSSTSMSELLNYSIIIVYFTLLYIYEKAETKNNKRLLYTLLMFCFLSSFIRIIYILLFLPLIFNNRKVLILNRKTIYFLIIWAFFSICLFEINSLFVSPFPTSFLSELFSKSSFLSFVSSFIHHLILNILRFLYPFRDDFVQVFQRYIILALMIWFFVKSRIIKNRFSQIDPLYFNSFILIFLSLLINIFAYDVFMWRDYRVIAPILFGIILYLVLNNRFEIVKYFFLINTFGLLILCFSPKVYGSFFMDSERYMKPEMNQVLSKIKYSKNATNKFENTLVISDYEKNVFLNTPAGIGITYTDSVSDKLKSKYIYSHKRLQLKTYKIETATNKDFLYQKK